MTAVSPSRITNTPAFSAFLLLLTSFYYVQQPEAINILDKGVHTYFSPSILDKSQRILSTFILSYIHFQTPQCLIIESFIDFKPNVLSLG